MSNKFSVYSRQLHLAKSSLLLQHNKVKQVECSSSQDAKFKWRIISEAYLLSCISVILSLVVYFVIYIPSRNGNICLTQILQSKQGSQMPSGHS